MFSALEIFFGNALYKFTFYLLTYLLLLAAIHISVVL